MIPTHKQRGFVLVTMTFAAIAMLGALGLAVDMGRVFIIKNETQHFCDAAAIAAALKLDGTTAGITNATAAAKSLANNWNFGTTSISNPIVEYATTSSGAWSTNPSPATDYIYARVKTSVSAPLFFLPVVMTTKVYTQTINSQAIAGQVALTTLNTGLAPYAGIVQDPNATDLGMVVGRDYALQQAQFNGGAQCRQATPERCYIAPAQNLCSGDLKPALWQTASIWGSNTNGYWGYTNNNLIKAAVLDLIQLLPIGVCSATDFTNNTCPASSNIAPSLANGDMAAQAIALDARVNQDLYLTEGMNAPPLTTYNNYETALHNGTANGRRLMTAPIVWPVTPAGGGNSGTTTVLGYGLFLLHADTQGGGASNYYSGHNAVNSGVGAYCAIYTGPFVAGSGTAGSSRPGAYQVQLVQ